MKAADLDKALDGFIDFFKKQECLSGCSHCRYCQEVADRVVKFDRAEADQYVSVIKGLLDDLASSHVFDLSSSCEVSGVSTRR